ncbi:HSF-type DNA-binding protein [Nitzschia inconspicua]|uniref:HSF-type DNA-binding protein n=1 Tax=Nitzschia inconspicua TaxID=303405 RepID=A0A9K3M4C1_9STRA|nr:HSF-type DNA-binding protein [Nitzschia inconspicua]
MLGVRRQWVHLNVLSSITMDNVEGNETFAHYSHQTNHIQMHQASSSSIRVAFVSPSRLAVDEKIAIERKTGGQRSIRQRNKEVNRKSSRINNDLLSNLKLPFPWKLYHLLEESVLSSTMGRIISWMGDNSFRVHDPEEFVKCVMPKFFRMSKFQSFTRQLYIYGFSKIEGGQCHGAFFHPRFVRGNKDLSLTIARNISGDRRLKSSECKEGETLLQLQERKCEQQASGFEDDQQSVASSSHLPTVVNSTFSIEYSMRSLRPPPQCSNLTLSALSNRAGEMMEQQDCLHKPFDPVLVKHKASSTTPAPESFPRELDLSCFEPRPIEEMSLPLPLPDFFPPPTLASSSSKKPIPK